MLSAHRLLRSARCARTVTESSFDLRLDRGDISHVGSLDGDVQRCDCALGGPAIRAKCRNAMRTRNAAGATAVATAGRTMRPSVMSDLPLLVLYGGGRRGRLLMRGTVIGQYDL